MSNQTKSRPAVRYSEAFKMEIVRELEGGLINNDQIRRKYGIGGCYSIRRWVSKYGNGTIGKVIHVKKPEEINESDQLKRRVRALEKALADSNIELALERQFTRLACERAGVKDVQEFKKKAAGKLRTEP